MFDLGDPVPLSVSVFDASGNPANATSVALTITRPDGTTTTATVTNPQAGVYEATYTPVDIGRHLVRWVATGLNASAFTDVFDVRPAASVALFSLSDARAILKLSSTTNDEELRTFVDATTYVVEERVGPIIPRSVTETLRLRGRRFALSHPPIVSLDNIQPVLIGAWPESVDDLVFDPITGLVERTDRGGFSNDYYTVTYTAGLNGLVPPHFALAARIILKDLWAVERGSGTTRPGSGGNDVVTMLDGYIIPTRAAQLLEGSQVVDGIA